MENRTQQPGNDVKVKTLAAQGAQDKLEVRLYTPAEAQGTGLIGSCRRATRQRRSSRFRRPWKTRMPS
jgi:hypothetical protein